MIMNCSLTFFIGTFFVNDINYEDNAYKNVSYMDLISGIPNMTRSELSVNALIRVYNWVSDAALYIMTKYDIWIHKKWW